MKWLARFVGWKIMGIIAAYFERIGQVLKRRDDF